MSVSASESPQPPKLEIYLIRHAESEMNTNPHLVGGRSNEAHLTQKGVTQAKNLGHFLLSKGIIPVKVYVSPATRTIETATNALGAMGLDVEPLVQDEIQELSQGVHEGRPRDEVYTPEILGDIEKQGKDFKLEAGESMNDVGVRMHGWLSETFGSLVPQEGTERFFVFTHGGAIKYLASHLEDWDHLRTYEAPIDNASVSLFTYQNGQWALEYLNRVPDTQEI